jgi:DNA-binding PadR family transcriptional regulator
LVRIGLVERLLPWKSNGARLYRLTPQGREEVNDLPDDIYERHQKLMAKLAEDRRKAEEYYAAIRGLLDQTITGEISMEEGEARAHNARLAFDSKGGK